MTEALKIDRLTKQFGLKTAVDNVSFIANKGEVLGFPFDLTEQENQQQ
ncbi:MAG: hypothetical protein CM15mP62_16480 [Rhodospirillaceae bacterium]|nr:MAG: hypothetical protein CM15mP62_16480 [Rhodospirillaceae bacterium]